MDQRKRRPRCCFLCFRPRMFATVVAENALAKPHSSCGYGRKKVSEEAGTVLKWNEIINGGGNESVQTARRERKIVKIAPCLSRNNHFVCEVLFDMILHGTGNVGYKCYSFQHTSTNACVTHELCCGGNFSATWSEHLSHLFLTVVSALLENRFTPRSEPRSVTFGTDFFGPTGCLFEKNQQGYQHQVSLPVKRTCCLWLHVLWMRLASVLIKFEYNVSGWSVELWLNPERQIEPFSSALTTIVHGA